MGSSVKAKQISIAILVSLLILFTPDTSLATNDDKNFSYISRGFFRILTAAFQIPQYLVHKTLSEPLGVGTVDGALTGAYYAVRELAGGALDIARGVAPYAKYLVFFI